MAKISEEQATEELLEQLGYHGLIPMVLLYGEEARFIGDDENNPQVISDKFREFNKDTVENNSFYKALGEKHGIPSSNKVLIRSLPLLSKENRQKLMFNRVDFNFFILQKSGLLNIAEYGSRKLDDQEISDISEILSDEEEIRAVKSGDVEEMYFVLEKTGSGESFFPMLNL